MDFLNPKKERQNRIILIVGYVLVAMAIGAATLLLLLLAYGYQLTRNGTGAQNGLVFLSSQPSGASIYLDGKLYSSKTNARLLLPAARYNVQISAPGYRDWRRQIIVAGGDLQRFDYPFLFPTNLQVHGLHSFNVAPDFMTQSPDKRWLLFADAAHPGDFTEYDTKSPDKPQLLTLSLPNGGYTPSTGAQSWSVVDWAADNKHVLLLHSYLHGKTKAHEYIMLDRDNPVDSFNATKQLSLGDVDQLSLYNEKPDQFYAYDQKTKTLRTLSSDNSLTPSKLLNILAYKTYGNGYVLYVTDHAPNGSALSGTVDAMLRVGQQTMVLRDLPVSSTYALNLAQYSGDWYMAIAAGSDTNAYIYKNPQSFKAPAAAPDAFPDPWRRLVITHPTYVGFSANTQFIVAESGQHFAVYDAENDLAYSYASKQPLDKPQTHATWMDGDRLMYVSGGKLVVFDYDYQNVQTLQAADPTYLPAFASDYSYVYTLRPTKTGQKPTLTTTPLTVKK